MEDFDTSVWVSNLEVPVPRDIPGYFSSIGVVVDVIIPDASVGECLVLFDEEACISEALAYNGKSYRDSTISVSLPTYEQLELARLTVQTDRDKQAKHSSIRQAISNLSPSELDDMVLLFQESAKEKRQEYSAYTSHLGVSNQAQSRSRVSNPYAFDSTSLPAGQIPQPLSSNSASNPAPNYLVHPYSCPKIIFFSGDPDKDAPYLQWRNEVRCLLSEGHPSSNILQGIRRSLKGTAAEVLLNLGEGVTPREILQKFDTIFGIALTSEVLLEDFYTAKQKAEEKAVVWSCRLERLFKNACERGFATPDSNNMLRNKFWAGLNDDRIKNAIRHGFDAGESFQQLVTAARIVEHERSVQQSENSSSSAAKSEQSTIKKAKLQSQVAQSQSPNLESKLDSLVKTMREMNARLSQLEKSRGPKSDKPKSPSVCFYCKQEGHFIRDCEKLKRKNAQNHSGN